MPDNRRSMRADARRNRELITRSAKAAFARHGTAVALEDIARQAGVGIATLYRHFPDRDALLVHVARDCFSAVIAQIDAGHRPEGAAWDAIERLAHQTKELQVVLTLASSSAHAWQVVSADDEVARSRDDLVSRIGSLVERAQREGVLRADVAVADVVVMFSLMLQPTPVTDRVAVDVEQRVRTLILESLRYRPDPLPLPGSAPTPDDLGRDAPPTLTYNDHLDRLVVR